MSLLILRNCRPVAGLRGEFCFRVACLGGAEAARRVIPLLVRKRDAPPPEIELSKIIFSRQITFEAVPLLAVRLEHEDARRPANVESVESGEIFFDVDFYGYEISGDVVTYIGIGINLGIQPSACSSGGRGAEIDEDELAGNLRLRERFVCILLPCNSHLFLPSSG